MVDIFKVLAVKFNFSSRAATDKDDRVRQGKIGEDGLTWSIFVVCLNFKHNFHLTDHEGRNFLHYAAKNGNYYGFDYTAQLLSDDDLGGKWSTYSKFLR
jgi:hypothetical protein